MLGAGHRRGTRHVSSVSSVSRHHVVAVLTGIAAAAVSLACTAVDARAYSAERLALRREALALVDHPFPGQGGDVRMLAAAFQPLGLAGGLFDAARTGNAGSASDAVFTALCGDGVDPTAEPVAPGDLFLYNTRSRNRLGIAVSESDVLVVDPSSGLGAVTSVRSLTGDSHAQGVPLAGFLFSACRLSPDVVPGAADVLLPPDHVVLGDPATAFDQLGDLAAQPRDADAGLPHGLATMLGHAVGSLLGLASTVIGLAGGLLTAGFEWVHQHLGVFAYVTPLLAGWLVTRLFTTTLDLRGAHAVLVTVAAIALVLSPVGQTVAVVTALFAMAGAVTGWWSPRRLAGAAWVVAWNVGVMGVDLFTGIDGSRPSSAGVVLVALASDVLVFAKPLALGMRAASLAERTPGVARAVEVGGRVGERVVGSVESVTVKVDRWRDAMQAQPSAIEDIVSAARRGRGPSSAAMAVPGAAAPAAGGVRGGVAFTARALDFVTVPIRGTGTLFSNVLDAAAGGLELVTRHVARAMQLARVGGRLPPGMARPLLEAASGRLAAADEVTARIVMEAAAPSLRATAQVSNVHSFTRAVANALEGTGPPTWQPASPLGPVTLPDRLEPLERPPTRRWWGP